MLYYLFLFNSIVGFAALLAMSLQYLEGYPRYISIVASIILALGNYLACLLSNRKDKIKLIAFSLIKDTLKKIKEIGVPVIMEIAQRPNMRNITVEILKEGLCVEPDAEVRCWMYVALGCIGGRQAKKAIKRGISCDPHKFARNCAQDALMMDCNQLLKK